MAKRIVVDPITRIEGHLRIDVEVDGGKVKKAWSSGQMWRGIENMLIGRDPRDAWFFVQRFCGVCTTVHAISSIRSVEDALKVEIPFNAQMIRNMVMASHALQDHIVHFYHLSALDFVDIVSALEADPRKTAQLAQSISDYPANSIAEFRAVKERLAGFVNKGNLGIFSSGYWGHPEMKLSPEENLMAFAHYLRALEIQRKAAQVNAIMGGKNPHIQNLCVGGVATAVNMDGIAALNIQRIAEIKTLLGEIREFVHKVYVPDVIAVASKYKDWFNYGAGVTNYLAVPEFPLDSKNSSFALQGGFIKGGDLGTFQEIKTNDDPLIRTKITESVASAWYEGATNLHPYDGETKPNYTDFQDEGKYSWCKSPLLDNEPVQVGPLANVFAAYLAGNEKIKGYTDFVAGQVGIGLDKLHSTMGRHAARAIRCAYMADMALEFTDMLINNLAKGDKEYVNNDYDLNAPGEHKGVGFHEACRGTLSHWIVIEDGKIKNYQAVVPSTWNAGPKAEGGVMLPYEASLIDNPIADPEKPLEVLRTIHSFDPCLACAIHTVNPEGKEYVKVKAL